jgi:hypothetical protein
MQRTWLLGLGSFEANRVWRTTMHLMNPKCPVDAAAFARRASADPNPIVNQNRPSCITKSIPKPGAASNEMLFWLSPTACHNHDNQNTTTPVYHSSDDQTMRHNSQNGSSCTSRKHKRLSPTACFAWTIIKHSMTNGRRWTRRPVHAMSPTPKDRSFFDPTGSKRLIQVIRMNHMSPRD